MTNKIAKRIQVEEINIKNFKVFHDAKIKIENRLFVLIGKNGCGKSTFFKVFEFLKTCLKTDINKALRNLGGYEKVTTRGHEKDNIEITIILRAFDENDDKSRRVTYQIILKPDGKGGAIVARELLKYRLGRGGNPWHFIDFYNGKGDIVENEDAYEDNTSKPERITQELKNSYSLALEAFSGIKKYNIIREFKELLENWEVYDLQNKTMQKPSDSSNIEHLEKDGNNLPRYVHHIATYYKETYDKTIETIKKLLVGISDVKPIEQNGLTFLNFYDKETEFTASEVSDGTIKLFAYLMLLNDPEPAPLICIEEPENYLYPDLLKILAEELRKYAQYGNGQVFVSTHDAEFLDAIKIDEAYIVSKANGFSKIEALSNNKKLKKYFDGGSPLGWLWQEEILESAINE